MAENVHGKDGSGTWRDLRLKIAYRNVVGVRLGVDKDRSRADKQNHINACREGKRRDEDFVARSKTERRDDKVKRRRAGIHGDGVFDADVVRQTPLELDYFGAKSY